MTALAPMLDRPFASDEELEELVSEFEDGTLPKPRWTHRAHLAVGLVYCDRMPAPVALALLNTEYGVRWDYLSAAGVTLMIPTLVFTFFMQKYIVRGLTFGAVKG